MRVKRKQTTKLIVFRFTVFGLRHRERLVMIDGQANQLVTER